MGATAAWLHGFGEIEPSPYEFCMPNRKQTKRPNLVLRKREFDPDDVALVAGIPATKPARTVVDLIDYGEDLSLVANVLADALEKGLIDDEGTFRKSIDARARDADCRKASASTMRLREDGTNGVRKQRVARQSPEEGCAQ